MKPMLSKELKVAEKITHLVSDLTLDLDQVGVYLASNNPIIIERLIEIIEAVKLEKNAQG